MAPLLFLTFGKTCIIKFGDKIAYGYTGRWYGGYTELLHLRARWYLPESGTFLSVDPVESEPPYQYVRGNVVNRVDPSGLASTCQNGNCKVEVQMRRIKGIIGWLGYHASIIFTDLVGHQTEHSAYPSNAVEGDTFEITVDLTWKGLNDPGIPFASISPPPCKTIEEALISGDYTSPMCEVYFYHSLPPRGGDSLYGVIEPYQADHNRLSREWDKDAPRVTVAEGLEACQKKICIMNALTRIGEAQIPYAFMGPNSNSSVASTLKSCNLPVERPTILGIAPGWWIDNLLSSRQMYGGQY